MTGIASAKALKLDLLVVLEEEQEGPCGWNVVIKGEDCRDS